MICVGYSTVLYEAMFVNTIPVCLNETTMPGFEFGDISNQLTVTNKEDAFKVICKLINDKESLKSVRDNLKKIKSFYFNSSQDNDLYKYLYKTLK